MWTSASALAGEPAQKPARVTFVRFVFHPDGKTETGTSFKYPDAKSLDIECTLDAAETCAVSLDASAFDQSDARLARAEQKVKLAKGERSVTFKDFLSLADVFGKQHIRVEVDVTGEGLTPIRVTLTADVEGPPEPSVQMLDVWPSPLGMRAPFSYFSPGDRFTMLFHYQVIDSATDRAPTLSVFATVDNEYPDVERARPHETWWGETKAVGKPGFYEVTVRGTAPRYFQNYDESTHKLTFTYRLYFSDKLKWDGRTSFDLFDPTPGLSRQSSFDEDLWVKLDYGYRWRVREMKQDEYFDSRNNWLKG